MPNKTHKARDILRLMWILGWIELNPEKGGSKYILPTTNASGKVTLPTDSKTASKATAIIISKATASQQEKT